MAGFGAKAYSTVGTETGVAVGSPHRLILMLFDGAITALHQASSHLHAGRIPEKCSAVGKALRIVDEGLRVSVDVEAGGELGRNLVSLYEYMTMRLLQANLKNDVAALDEVRGILTGLRSAWVQIEPPPGPVAVPAAVSPRSAARVFA